MFRPKLVTRGRRLSWAMVWEKWWGENCSALKAQISLALTSPQGGDYETRGREKMGGDRMGKLVSACPEVWLLPVETPEETSLGDCFVKHSPLAERAGADSSSSCKLSFPVKAAVLVFCCCHRRPLSNIYRKKSFMPSMLKTLIWCSSIRTPHKLSFTVTSIQK